MTYNARPPLPRFFCRREGVRTVADCKERTSLWHAPPPPRTSLARIEETILDPGVRMSAINRAHSFGQGPLLLGRRRDSFFSARDRPAFGGPPEGGGWLVVKTKSKNTVEELALRASSVLWKNHDLGEILFPGFSQ